MARPRERRGRRGVIAERLRAARAARELTQAEAADELGVALPTVARYETGALRPRGLAARYLDLWCAAALGEPIDLPGLKDRSTR